VFSRHCTKSVRIFFFWLGMDADIRARVTACQTCAISKPLKETRFGQLASDTASAPMEKIFLDMSVNYQDLR
jgi:hypothetical protein